MLQEHGEEWEVFIRQGQQGATYFIPAVLVPLLLITHGLMFRLLLKRESGGTGQATPAP